MIMTTSRGPRSKHDHGVKYYYLILFHGSMKTGSIKYAHFRLHALFTVCYSLHPALRLQHVAIPLNVRMGYVCDGVQHRVLELLVNH